MRRPNRWGLWLLVVPALLGADTPDPTSVGVPGNYQAAAGCPGDWQPDCPATQLAYDAGDDAWQGELLLQPGSVEYKVALNGRWDENYGAGGVRNGPNIGFTLGAAQRVKFYYSHQTHWATSSAQGRVVVAPGSFQSELGCPGDWQPDCLRSWLQDPDGDGVFTLTTTALPPGTYELKVALGESWDENYGADGARNGANVAFTVTRPLQEVTLRWDSASKVPSVGVVGAPRGNLGLARGHFLGPDLLAWRPGLMPAGTRFVLHAAPEGGLALTPDGVTGGTAYPLAVDAAGLPADVRARFPHLAGLPALRLAPADAARAGELVQGQLALEARSAEGVLLDATSLQLPGVLDALYAYDGPLGVTFAGGVPTVRLWAPTATGVRLLRFADAAPGTLPVVEPLTRLPGTGVWAVTGTPAWKGQSYLFEVDVYVRGEGRRVTNRVTDPYSVALTTNSLRSQLVDLDDPALAPQGWARLKKPALAAPEDIVLYELHVRDFSAGEAALPEAERGTFRAFTRDTAGTRHLRRLAKAGLTHVHLLPAFDFATVDEDRRTWAAPAGDLAAMPPDGEGQQAAVRAVAGRDGFNWGYDPLHYTVPEGSYAVSPEGGARVREFREMVAALSHDGLRVVMDVVYNHTTASGQDARSVLDRVVPGYYHRLNADGLVETSTCCQNTATEHAMMEKLMVDSLVTWARAYKVDGFRFDLMGHHMKRNLLRARAALDALTPERDGVDGRAVYLYGEGWNFGEVVNGARGTNATQLNMPGTGIGTFSDRLRDAVRGGGPFSGLREQGFATGLALEPNGTDGASPGDQHARLRHFVDLIRVGLAGNLADFPLVTGAGAHVVGAQVDYNGQPAGYTRDPQEVITYVSAHDNETLFDAVQLKAAAGADVAERARMQALGLSLVLLGQGIPFVHAGDELLRSKSLDRNSYDSGDWFNRLDFTGRTNGFGSGLPPGGDNGFAWDTMRPLLADPALRPAPAHMEAARAAVLELLRIRKSTPLFRLRTRDEVLARVGFLNEGPSQEPGLIVMTLDGRGLPRPSRYARVVVLFNAAPSARRFVAGGLAGLPLALHPVQQDSQDARVRTARFDPATGAFEVPGRTTAVFVLHAQGVPLTAADTPQD